MEFVGKQVRKDSRGGGGALSFTGIVKSYDPSSGSFEIVYEDGDSEELDFTAVAAAVVKEDQLAAGEVVVDRCPRLGRKPKKRRRVDRDRLGGGGEEEGGSIGGNGVLLDMNSVNVDLREGEDDGAVSGGSEVGDENCGRVGVDLNETIVKECDVDENSRGIGVENGIMLHADLGEKQELDLNAAFSLNLNEVAFDLNEDDHGKLDTSGGLKDRGCIDLNLDANAESDENAKELDSGGGDAVDTLKKECGFDLNMGLDEEIKDEQDGYCAGRVKGDTDFETGKEDTQNTLEGSRVVEVNEHGVALSNGVVENHHGSNDNPCYASAPSVWKVGNVSVGGFGNCNSVLGRDAPDIKMDSNASIGRNQVETRRSGRRRKVAGNPSPTIEETVSANPAGGKEDVGVVIDGNQKNVGSACKDLSARRRKRRKFSDDPVQETVVLRRSARRGSAKKPEVTTAASDEVLKSVSPEVSALSDEKPRRLYYEPEEELVVLPPEVQLPPSSQNLDLGGIPALDLFSIYACLRSFSNLLFLSPFKLEDFVEAVKSNLPSVLFDCIHVSILQILRQHLEYLSVEGSESASDCLRSLNWDFLDLVTWPLFMVEYFLVHCSSEKHGLDPSSLKLFKSDYYQQPVSVKVGMLRCLCDDMIDAEAIRSELNKRSSGAELELDFDRNVNLGSSRKRKATVYLGRGSVSAEGAIDDTMDLNIDECCLCKMDGNLICCDGCPAAYHSKCVGVANDSLPEGDWYCPECAVDMYKPSVRHRKTLRGAEILGVDPHGRIYFGSCGYLLVSESSDADSSFRYYHRDDLHAVIDALRSSYRFYRNIMEAISKHLDVPVRNLNTVHHLGKLLPSPTLASTVQENVNERKSEGTASSGLFDASKSLSSTHISSEGSAETTQIGPISQIFQKEGLDGSNQSADNCNDPEMKNSAGEKHGSDPHSSDVNTIPLKTYMNYYSFGQSASRVAEDLMTKSSNKIMDGAVKSDEEMISAQMKIILKNTSKLRWPNIQSSNLTVQKEKCGWCFMCRAPMDDLDCLFNMSFGPVKEVPVREVYELQLKENRDGHLTDVIGHIIQIEERLQGLLLGPWVKPDYSRLWRENVLNAKDIASVKCLLLKLESNVHQRAISAEWLKHIDSSAVVGSASHIVVNSKTTASKSALGRKRGRSAESEPRPSNATGGLRMLWWRGGKLSRKLFSWKVLPLSLASKAARQAGHTKIQGILYPENSDFARRTKSLAWRAAVQSSSTAQLLALQVRELDSNIKWDEIDNRHALSALDKEYKKSLRLFKKVIVRRKCSEGEGTKYLLDFGTRKSIPEVITKNGSVVQESSNEKKRYWVSPVHFPLHMLKNFEEKRAARKSSKVVGLGKPSKEKNSFAKSSSEKKGFAYLFARSERPDHYQCGHCKKDVLISEAVCCQSCEEFFHKRHVRKSGSSNHAECVYTCHHCFSGNHIKVGKKKAGKGSSKSTKTGIGNPKAQLSKSKKVAIVRRSVRLKRGGTRKGLRGRPPRVKDNQKVTPPGRKGLRGRPPLVKDDQKGKRPRGRPPLVKDGLTPPIKRSRGRPPLVKDTGNQTPLRKSLRGRPPLVKKDDVKKDDDRKPPPVVVTYLRRSARQAPNREQLKLGKEFPLCQKKRSSASHSYWLNGIRVSSATPEDERVVQFQKTRLVAASAADIVNNQQPKCSLCRESEYTSTSNYISCELCEVWFHGDAFGLDSSKINKVIGFRCHSCRERSPPSCPFVEALKSDEPQVAPDDVQNDDVVAGSDNSEDADLGGCEARPMETDNQQDSNAAIDDS
ncbi:DDT domain-containing protein PTM [Linum grandiflorum]